MYIDIRYFLIPDFVSLPMIALGLVFSFLLIQPGWKSCVYGVLFGFSLLLIVSLIYQRTKKEVGIGGGDIKYIAGIGAFWGLEGVFFIVFISSCIALIFFLIKARIKKNSEKGLPFGPFLTFASYIYMMSDIFLY